MPFLPEFPYFDIDTGIEILEKYKFNYYLPENENIIFHVYWYGDVGRKQIASINSYLKSQNLETSVLWVWLDEDTYHFKNIPQHPNIKIKKYIPEIESLQTPFENLNHLTGKKHLKFRSDLARMIFLYKYGGVYFDLDMFLLRDIRCILNLEFCYVWCDLEYGNNAILRLKKQSKLSIQIMNRYLEILKSQTFNINFNKLIFTFDLDIMYLPSVLFDPVWILDYRKKKSKYSKLNKFDDFFKNTDENIELFFNQKIFGYHWHSRNNVKIEKNSYFERLEFK